MRKPYYEEVKTNLSSFEIYKLFYKKKLSVFLDSGKDEKRLGRYSFIACEPFATFNSKNNSITIEQNGEVQNIEGNPFDVLTNMLGKYKIDNNTEFPFVGGAIGFFSYDLCHQVEKLPRLAKDDIDLPDLVLGFYDGIVLIDHLEQKVYAIASGMPDGDIDTAKNTVQKLKKIIVEAKIEDTTYLDNDYKNNKVELVSNFTKDDYCKVIDKTRAYIRKGDIYQANITQRFTTLIDRHPINIYEHLRNINPAPFAAYMDYGSFKVVSSSPERFIRIQKGLVETRPIKGTMPRGKTEEEDFKNREQLVNSKKDRAENLMIVDLMRNDIGRVCEINSVQVPELFCIEEYATVFHLVSTVTGRLQSDKNCVDCIRATFPGGSITGAPKIRSMEIIDELEPTCRHIYTGSIGYIGFDGDMDLNIVIRTILIKDDRAYYQVGGGIVWDSVAEKEYQETLDKGYAIKKVLLNEN